MKNNALVNSVLSVAMFVSTSVASQSKRMDTKVNKSIEVTTKQLNMNLWNVLLDVQMRNMSLEQLQYALLVSLNRVRDQHHLSKFYIYKTDLAQQHSIYLARSKEDTSLSYGDHFDENWLSLTTRAMQSNIPIDTDCRGSCRRTGENLATANMTVREVMAAWLNSPVHAENILSPSFNAIAIGCASNWNNVVLDLFNVK